MRTIGLFLCLLATSAFADAVEVALSNPRVMQGKGTSALRISIAEPIANYRVVLKRSDGFPLTAKGGGKPGSVRNVDLPSPVGAFTWIGTLTVEFPNATTSELPLELQTEVVGPLALVFDKDKDVDLPNRTIHFQITNPVKKVHLTVRMDTGDTAIDRDIEFNGEPGKTPLDVSWPDVPGKPLKVSLVVFDTAGYFVGVDLFPWSIEIPHEDVEFDSGKFDVLPTQQAKIDASAGLIQDAVTKFGRFADVKLFVAGHTDTVGPAESNRALSLNRAKAIALAFRKKGLRIPMLVTGFGEEAPAVVTPDETPEVKNRRAQYVVSIDNPSVTNVSSAPRWQPVK